MNHVKEVAHASNIKNNSQVYLLARVFDKTQPQYRLAWYWVTWDDITTPKKLKLVKYGERFNPLDFEATKGTAFTVSLSSAADPVYVEDAGRFSLNGIQVDENNNMVYSSGCTPAVWKLNWFSTQVWDNIVDFGMRNADNIFNEMSDYPQRPAYPQAVFGDYASEKFTYPMRYVGVDTDKWLKARLPSDVHSMSDLGILNFRMILTSCAKKSSDEGKCDNSKVPGFPHNPFGSTNERPSVKKSDTACSNTQVTKCLKLMGAELASCAKGIASGKIIPTSGWSVAQQCFTYIMQNNPDGIVPEECKQCACQSMGCPDLFCASHGCGGTVAAPLVCHTDTDCVFYKLNGESKCAVLDPENKNKDWQSDFCAVVDGADACACTFPDIGAPELQCQSDSDCGSTKSLTDYTTFGYDEHSLVKYSTNELMSSAQCGMQAWKYDPSAVQPTQYYYGGAVCNNSYMPAEYTCAGNAGNASNAECNTPAKGGGSTAPHTKIGRDCTVQKNAGSGKMPITLCVPTPKQLGAACTFREECANGDTYTDCVKGKCAHQTCSIDLDCGNRACGREHDVDNKMCCSTGQHCSNWGFDWCSGYGSKEKCAYDCQCTSGKCASGRCT